MSNVYMDLTTYENLAIIGKLFGLDNDLIKKKALELLRRFELVDRTNSKAKTLEYGM